VVGSVHSSSARPSEHQAGLVNGDTHLVMSEESTARDPVELMRALSDARTVDTTMAYYSADAVYDMSRMGMRVFEGRAAIRGFLEDWDNQYEDYDDEILEVVHLGGGVVFLVVRQNARPSGSPEHVRLRDVYGYVFVWADGKVQRATPHVDADEARAAAERLAESRG
jgi:ketosteroid isomerase-like protein